MIALSTYYAAVEDTANGSIVRARGSAKRMRQLVKAKGGRLAGWQVSICNGEVGQTVNIPRANRHGDGTAAYLAAKSMGLVDDARAVLARIPHCSARGMAKQLGVSLEQGANLLAQARGGAQ